jgi:hypothetical protein
LFDAVMGRDLDVDDFKINVTDCKGMKWIELIQDEVK